MTKEAAIYNFMSGFDENISAYKSTAVPDDVTYPYLVYDGTINYYSPSQSYATSITARLFYYTDSESVPNAAVKAISDKIGSGILLSCDEGKIWITKGVPWCQSTNDETDRTVKVRIINFDFRFLTT